MFHWSLKEEGKEANLSCNSVLHITVSSMMKLFVLIC